MLGHGFYGLPECCLKLRAVIRLMQGCTPVEGAVDGKGLGSGALSRLLAMTTLGSLLKMSIAV
jgi:hypothetical protein